MNADPPIHRFHEMAMVNGPAWNARNEEACGDGPMSVIGLDFERVANPEGDRVKITTSAKLLPCKYHGNDRGIPDDGFQEE